MFLVTRVFMGFFVVALMFFLPASAQAAVHTVSRGESLYTVSRSYGVSLDSLMKANGLTDSLIYPGRRLIIPESGGSEKNTFYTVQAGDTLYSIGKKHGLEYWEIMSANNLNNSLIHPGMVLALPAPAGAASAAQPAPETSRGGIFRRPSAAEVDLLARLITAEADAEPYEGKVAVGAVVLNRIASPDFPDTIKDVIYQYGDGTYQFEPVMNGWINRPASGQSVQAAKDALSGNDPSNGALYFFATSVDNPWLLARPLSKVIGNFVFAY
ncbi:MAG TPA: LysM peptidoglycan-binding domain-containing protein [Bacillota bacterium]|nr:LysM peptidoglycan-binding domain-containing protein [Bacillota bacterium]